jgi:hypothetical protein
MFSQYTRTTEDVGTVDPDRQVLNAITVIRNSELAGFDLTGLPLKEDDAWRHDEALHRVDWQEVRAALSTLIAAYRSLPNGDERVGGFNKASLRQLVWTFASKASQTSDLFEEIREM